MKTFSAILFLSAMAACSAGLLPTGDFYTADENGGYHFGFNDGRLARQEQRSPEGVVRGAYSYVDANGQTQTITYTADDHNGFLASGPSIPKIPEAESVIIAPTVALPLPIPVEETPEVKAARAEHLEAHRRALSGEFQSVPAPIVQNPISLPMQYAALRAPLLYAANNGLVGYGGYSAINYAGQPTVRYVIPGAKYHPDYQPYAAL